MLVAQPRGGGGDFWWLVKMQLLPCREQLWVLSCLRWGLPRWGSLVLRQPLPDHRHQPDPGSRSPVGSALHPQAPPGPGDGAEGAAKCPGRGGGGGLSGWQRCLPRPPLYLPARVRWQAGTSGCKWGTLGCEWGTSGCEQGPRGESRGPQGASRDLRVRAEKCWGASRDLGVRAEKCWA